MHALKAIANGRELWNTETGWHTAPSKVGFWPCKKTIKWTDKQVFYHLMGEASYNEAIGAEVMTVFQLNDGPDPNNYEHRFGIRTIDGALKPSAYIAKEWE